jgi:hypothetical protein
MAPVIPGEHVPAPQKARLMLEILRAYVQIRWWLRRMPLASVVAATRVEREPCVDVPPAGTFEARLVGARLANATRRTLKLLPTDSRCLAQSLVLSRLLGARGMPATLVIGARSADSFEAHAWVEQDSKPILPADEFGDYRLLEI